MNRNVGVGAQRVIGRILMERAVAIVILVIPIQTLGIELQGTVKRCLKNIVLSALEDIIVVERIVLVAIVMQKVNGMLPSASVIAQKGVILNSMRVDQGCGVVEYLVLVQPAWIPTVIGIMTPLLTNGPNLTTAILLGVMTGTKKI